MWFLRCVRWGSSAAGLVSVIVALIGIRKGRLDVVVESAITLSCDLLLIASVWRVCGIFFEQPALWRRTSREMRLSALQLPSRPVVSLFFVATVGFGAFALSMLTGPVWLTIGGAAIYLIAAGAAFVLQHATDRDLKTHLPYPR